MSLKEWPRHARSLRPIAAPLLFAIRASSRRANYELGLAADSRWRTERRGLRYRGWRNILPTFFRDDVGYRPDAPNTFVVAAMPSHKVVIEDILRNQSGWTAFVQPRGVILSAVRMINKFVASPENKNLVEKRLSFGAYENSLTKGRRSFIVRDTLNKMSGSHNRPRKACNQEPGNRPPAGPHKLFSSVSRHREAFSSARRCLNHPNQ